MFGDDLEPRNKKPTLKNLEPLSITELEEYTEALKDEIERVKREIDKKKAHKDAASSIFK